MHTRGPRLGKYESSFHLRCRGMLQRRSVLPRLDGGGGGGGCLRGLHPGQHAPHGRGSMVPKDCPDPDCSLQKRTGGSPCVITTKKGKPAKGNETVPECEASDTE